MSMVMCAGGWRVSGGGNPSVSLTLLHPLRSPSAVSQRSVWKTNTPPNTTRLKPASSASTLLFCLFHLAAHSCIFFSPVTESWQEEKKKTCWCVWSVFWRGNRCFWWSISPHQLQSEPFWQQKGFLLTLVHCALPSPSERGLVVDMLIAEKSNLKECITMRDFFSHVSPKITFTMGLK